MIAPRTPLLLGFALLVVPAATVATARPAALPLPAAAAAAFLLAAVWDALRSQTRLRSLSIEAPPVVRLNAGREGVLPLRVVNPQTFSRRLRLALELPAGAGDAGMLAATVPAGPEPSQLPVAVRSGGRGRYAVRACHVEEPSPLGLWAARRRVSLDSEMRVYPDLSRERRQLASLFLRRGGFGVHPHRQVGHGREFEKLREYVPGDGTEDIHWKATARRGRPITKVFQLERTQEIYVILDASRLSTRRTDSGECTATVLDRFLAAALVLGLAAERQGDRFGLVAFDARLRDFLPARTGRSHYRACRDALYALEPRDAAPDFDELFAALGGRLRRRALLVFLTSLDDPGVAEAFLRSSERMGRRHLMLVNSLRPADARPLFSEPSAASTEDLYRHLAGHLRWAELERVRRTLQARGVGFSLLEDERLAADLVARYVSVKQRQLL
jgi:uncharacterized protein (DUF58 family)